MGCSGSSSSHTIDYNLEANLERQRRSLLIQIDEDKIKIQNYENQIQNFENQIKDLENDIKLNQFQYKESELKAKVKKIIDLKKDQERAKRSLDSLTTINETMKNNLENIENNINKLSNMKKIQEGNEVMNQVKNQNHNGILQDNVENLLDQRARDEQTKKILQRANNQYLGNDPQYNEDAYLKELLGGTTGK